MLKRIFILCVSLSFIPTCNAAAEDPTWWWNPIEFGKKAAQESTLAVGQTLINHLTSNLTQQILPAAQDALAQTGAAVAANLRTELNQNVLPAAQDALVQTGAAVAANLRTELNQNVLPAAQDALAQTGAVVAANLRTEMNQNVLPAAHTHLQQLADHAIGQLSETIKSAALSCCWIALGICGAKLVCDGVKKHKGEAKSKETAKTACGIACIAIALCGVYNSF